MSVNHRQDTVLSCILDCDYCMYACMPVNHKHDRLAPMWQQSGTLLFCSCHGIAGFLVDELQT